MRSRKRSFASVLFGLTIVGSSGFAACASLKSAAPVDSDGGTLHFGDDGGMGDDATSLLVSWARVDLLEQARAFA